MIRIYEYHNAEIFNDFENYVFTVLSSHHFDIPNDKVTIRGIDYRISSINQERPPCEECEDCEEYLFDVIFKSYEGGKIGAIKSVKAITGLGLKEAKEFVETLPNILLSNVEYNEINDAKTIFESNRIIPCLDIIKTN